jgi:hypothetical protein
MPSPIPSPDDDCIRRTGVSASLPFVPPRPVRRHRRRSTLGLLAVLVVVLGLVGASCHQLHEDNRAQAIFGASNGQLPAQWLVPATTGCTVYWEAAASLRELLANAARDGIALTPVSCYRDYAGQVAARESWCARGACHMAAVPGTSNHGWGKAVDFRDGSGPMTYDSPGYRWLLEKAGFYGWLHPKVMKADGPVPEPWHWEWVGDGGRMFPGEYFGIGNSLPMTGDPIGNLEYVGAEPGRIRLIGWTFDPDQQDPIDVHVYVSGGWGGSHRADKPRADVAAAYPAYFSKPHGFDITIPWWPGTYEVCAYPINAAGPGTNPELGCRTVTVPPPAGTANLSPTLTTVPTTSTTSIAPGTTTSTTVVALR